MSVTGFENSLRVYPVVLSALKASSDDICVNCIGLESAKIKVEKGLMKLKMDAAKSAIPEERKKEMISKLSECLRFSL